MQINCCGPMHMLKSFLTTTAIVLSTTFMVAQNKKDLTLKQIDSLGNELVRQKQDHDVARLTCHKKEERDSIERALRSTEDFLQLKDIAVTVTKRNSALENENHPGNYMEVYLAAPGRKLRRYKLDDNSPLIKRHAQPVSETSGARLTPAQIDSVGNALAGHHYEAHKTDFMPYHGAVDKDSIMREIALAKEFLARHQVIMPYQASLGFPGDQDKKQGVVDRVELELQLPDGQTKTYNHNCYLSEKQRVVHQGWFWNF